MYYVLINNVPFLPKDFLRKLAYLKDYKIEEKNFNGGQAYTNILRELYFSMLVDRK